MPDFPVSDQEHIVWPCSNIADFAQDAEIIRQRRFGMIEVVDGALARIVVRPWPKVVSIVEAALIGAWRHRRRSGDRIRLYYKQPWRLSNYLVLQYAESARSTSLRSLNAALAALDEVARLKGSDALLCEITNHRISGELARRWGWEAHCRSSWRRHFIKRFYGVYPDARPPYLFPRRAAG
jgi:hypothetical protein